MVANRTLTILVAVLIVILIGVAWQSQRTSTQLDDVQIQVNALKDFVDELQESSPDDEAQNAAISEAVRLVPEIRVKQTEIIEILCGAFPDARACQSGG